MLKKYPFHKGVLVLFLRLPKSLVRLMSPKS